MTCYQIPKEFNRAPGKDSDRKSIRLHNNLWMVIDGLAANEGGTRTSFIRLAILEKLERLAQKDSSAA